MVKRSGIVSMRKKRYLDGDGISLAGFDEEKISIAIRVFRIEFFSLEGCISQYKLNDMIDIWIGVYLRPKVGPSISRVPNAVPPMLSTNAVPNAVPQCCPPMLSPNAVPNTVP